MLLGTSAVILATAGAAAGVTGHASVAARCGTRYTPACTRPVLKGGTISVACRKPGSRLNFANIVARSLPGIRRITVTINGKVVLSYHSTGLGPQSKTLRLSISSKGLRSGVHSIKITVTDIRGKSVSKTVRFAICFPPPPPFTG